MVGDLTAEAQRLLEALPRDGVAVSNRKLRTLTGLDQASYSHAIQLLKAAGRIRIGRDRGGSVALAVPPSASFTGEGRKPRAAGIALSADASRILQALPADGSMIGNIRLRSIVNLDNEAYARAIQDLRAAHLIRVGSGRGGSVGRVLDQGGAVSTGESTARGVYRESELYTPFVAWLKSTWVHDPALRFAHAKVTATPRGRPRDSGKWSRPDVTCVQVWRFEWLPEVLLEVSSYEIKRAVEAAALDNVYEAAAHGRWAHRASLVIERDPAAGALPERILLEASRFGLGLYVMEPRGQGGFEVHRELEPKLLAPELSDVNELLAYFFEDEDRLRNDYRTAIGR